MAKTVVGMFDSFDEAQQVVSDLTDSGFPREDISLVANDSEGRYQNMGRQVGGGDKMNDTEAEQAGSGAVAGAATGGILGLLVGLGALAIPGIGPVLAAGPLAAALGSTALGAGIGAASGALVGPLVDAGIPRPEAELYNEGIRRGGTLVMVRTDDNMAERAADIMERHNVIDIDRRGDDYRTSGWSGYNENDKPYTRDQLSGFNTGTTGYGDRGTTLRNDVGTTSYSDRDTTRTRDTTMRNRDLNQGEEVLPVIEEDIQVGKRQVEGGRTRIHTKITEKPVEENVHLREERVNVERRPVDRPIGDADTAFRESSFEVTERREEPVVQKQARVVEEVVVNKDVRERDETVRDTVRRQDVHVHEDDAVNTTGTTRTTGMTGSTTGYDAFDSDYRNYYTSNLADSGYSYDQYSPVFRYGHSLGTDKRYSGRDWSEIEPEARRYWEERNPNTWEQFKDSVRYAWDRARGKA